MYDNFETILQKMMELRSSNELGELVGHPNMYEDGLMEAEKFYGLRRGQKYSI